jgi:formylglycine-generating enzyme required for sulfatase activity
VMRTAVVAHDPNHALEPELLGRGTLALTVVPANAELFLFRFESYEAVRAGDVIPRLVPVPTAGIGRVREAAWAADFHPGDECLVVRAVEHDSPASRAGLRAGDLVIRIEGLPCRGALFVRDATSAPGVPLLAHVVALDDAPLEDLFDWRRRVLGDKEPQHRVRFSTPAEPVTCDPREIHLASATDLLAHEAPAVIHLECLRAGEPVTLDVPTGARSGLDCELSAYPLICASTNRLSPGAPLTVDPGSYLVLARAEGREELHTNVMIARGAQVETSIDLLPGGTTPPGFVYVPAGPFLEGGDPQAFNPRAERVTDVPGFFIARKELTNREWYAFVNDPDTLAKIGAAPAGAHLYLPQDDRVMARKAADGQQFEWDAYYATSADSPVLGISWNDAQDYLEWRNRRAAANGEAWRYDLPTESEWEKAARGVDGRAFPWGDRFDPSLAVCLARKDGFLLDAPGGFEPRDESPFGCLDMAGSREEWLRDAVEGSEGRTCRKRGGFWGTSAEIALRCASRPEASRDRFSSSQGLRLALRKP